MLRRFRRGRRRGLGRGEVRVFGLVARDVLECDGCGQTAFSCGLGGVDDDLFEPRESEREEFGKWIGQSDCGHLYPIHGLVNGESMTYVRIFVKYVYGYSGVIFGMCLIFLDLWRGEIPVVRRTPADRAYGRIDSITHKEKHMARLQKTLMTIGAVAICGLAIAGCSSNPSSQRGGEVVTYNKVSGTASTSAAATLDSAFDAAKGAMGDMQYTTESATKDALQAIVVAREADNSKVTVRMDRKAERVTEISVSIGAFGSETKARMILDKILARVN